jgi:hypothetical protein
MNIAESEGERTRIKSPLTMTARAEREVNGGAHLLEGFQLAEAYPHIPIQTAAAKHHKASRDDMFIS